MAVYTDVTAEDLGRFLAAYDVGELLSYKGIAEGVENSNFLVHASRGYFILTLYERRVAPHDLPIFLGLMEHLAARAITCPPPSSPSSTGCGSGGRAPAIARRSAKRSRSCISPAAISRSSARMHSRSRAGGRCFVPPRAAP